MEKGVAKLTQRETDTWREWDATWRAIIVAQSGFEWNFAKNVIQRVPGLKPTHVTPQRVFIGNDGLERHMDFGIEVGEQRIAVEVEGWDKTGEERGKNKTEHDEFNRRIQSLTADGWAIMTVTNAQFMGDPGFYAAQIRQLILPKSTTNIAPQPTLPHDTAPADAAIAGQPPERHDGTTSQRGNTLYWIISGVVVAVALALLYGIFSRVGEVPETPPQPATPTELVNPGNTKDCSDFATEAEAQTWFDTYVNQYGDVANLDGDKDGSVCVSLP